MQGDEKLTKILSKVEPVELVYNGLGGSIIQWTMDHGSKKAGGQPEEHPSLLAFLVGRDGKPFALLSNGQQYQAGSLAKWTLEQLDLYERAHPSTRLPFVTGHVDVDGEGTDIQVTCEEMEAARKAGRPMLLYFGRGHFEPKDKRAKKENKQARKFEKGTLNSKVAAKQSEGWTLLRFDVSDETGAQLAAKYGVEVAPDLLLWLPAEKAPQVLGRKMTGHALAALLKKHRPAPSK